ncbi:hypothetical protein LCGC14_2833320 [marine sediment metagenome]|uniref:Uncharacterized protein n=1 Tax=marine sediment metagenome TaxID=412755 RepID=A0A0F9B4G1_9ZZZZ
MAKTLIVRRVKPLPSTKDVQNGELVEERHPFESLTELQRQYDLPCSDILSIREVQ